MHWEKTNQSLSHQINSQSFSSLCKSASVITTNKAALTDILSDSFSDCVWTRRTEPSAQPEVLTRRVERDWYLGRGWCCFVLAWWLLGCWGSVRGPECCRWDAEWQPTGAAALGGRAKWLSYPGDCEHTTSLNKSASLTLLDTEEMKDLLYLSYQMCALHLQRPSARACERACVREASDSGGAGCRAMCSHKWIWPKLQRACRTSWKATVCGETVSSVFCCCSSLLSFSLQGSTGAHC